jgi:hypothetical protein
LQVGKLAFSPRMKLGFLPMHCGKPNTVRYCRRAACGPHRRCMHFAFSAFRFAIRFAFWRI